MLTKAEDQMETNREKWGGTLQRVGTILVPLNEEEESPRRPAAWPTSLAWGLKFHNLCRAGSPSL